VLEGVLGQGGFGITYKGRDTRLNRTVALKEFFPQAQGCLRLGTTVHPSGGITVGEFHEERNKFLEEGQRLAQFQHSSIVKVFSLFEENNTAYMVMEFLKGKTLLKMVEESGPLEERVLVPFIEQIAGALGLVHETNVIHRDIKPENVIVTTDNRAVLVDFGTAREFAAGKTRKMTTMLTPGYAPLEQYGQHARFGVFTDIYALGATTYHLLTGQVPIQATDRAAGVDLAAPRRLNNRISRQVSDAVMWAMEMHVAKRPQSAADFVQAMRGARSASSNGSGKGSAGTAQAAPNPYRERIEQLASELESPQPQFRSRHDQRIREINAELARIRSLPPLQAGQCPCCWQPTLKNIEGVRTPHCPICSGAQMKSRKIDQRLCPVCREGHIAPTKLEVPLMFCPVCRSRSLQKDKRKRFGLAIDVWWVCPGCSAEINVILGAGAKLVNAGGDPLGFGKDYLGQTLPIPDWQQLAPMSDLRWTCDRCAAQFYDLGESRLSLDSIERDPHGVKEKLLGKTYYRTIWAKLANGLSATVGNTHCPACCANFDYDQVDRKLKLLDCDRSRFPRAVAHLGQAHDLLLWSLFSAGKYSLSPGWVCSNCRVEFDKDGPGMKLIGGPPPFDGSVGETKSAENWQRLSRGLPSKKEEAALEAELNSLQAEALLERAHLSKAEEQQRAGIAKQIQDLVKQSFIGGFIPLEVQTKSIGLRKDEHVAWESGACRLKQRSSNGVPYWDSDGTGMLLVTDQRVIFRADTGAMWSKPVAKLLSADHDYIRDQGICVLWIDGQQKPVGFAGVTTSVTVTVGNNTFPLELTSHDLREMLQSRCGG
jgi:serine/threonine protein kinase